MHIKCKRFFLIQIVKEKTNTTENIRWKSIKRNKICFHKSFIIYFFTGLFQENPLKVCVHISASMQYWLIYFVIFFSAFEAIFGFKGFSNSENSTKLPPCKACKTFVASFKTGLERTAKYKFEGGDTDWEEKKLKHYANSEVRLVEIHENLCSDLTVGKEQCYELLEEYDESLEDWWFKKQLDEPDLLKYLCIDSFKVCCPESHFGRECTPCLGYPDKICTNNGKCKGSGTRKGDGKCHCDKGYEGDFCDKCAKSYYESYRDVGKILCSECHMSCYGDCSAAGPKGCSKCKSGWLMNKENECLDINECAAPTNPCTPLQFCVNSDGSYRCLDCDRSCAGCMGDGPDMCKNCASGYFNQGNICVDSSQENRRSFVSFSRYLTYLGLCIATCIILNKNTYLAAVIGSLVAIYITVAEYMLNSPPSVNKTDIGHQVAEQVKKIFN